MTDVRAGERLSDIDALVWAVEADPRNRTTIAAVARFDRPLDRRLLYARVERASRRVGRLRQRVDTAPNRPRWADDDSFSLGRHLRTVELTQGSDTALLSLVRDIVTQPFDRDRPLWEFTMVHGLADGDAALVLKAHHAVSDGVGGVEMMLELFDLSDTATNTDVAEGSTVADRAAGAPGRPPVPGRSDDATTRARRLGEGLGAAYRLIGRGASSPGLPAARSTDVDVRYLSVDLDDLRAAGRRVAGTINTAFVAAVALGIDAHAGLHGRAPLRIGVPVNTRTGGDGAGNHWRPSRIDVTVPCGAAPDTVASTIRERCAGLRDDPLHELVPLLAGGLRALPDTAAGALFAAASAGVDVAASNVPGSPVALSLCGEPVRALIPFGPLSGAAVNVTLLSHAGAAHIGITSDRAVIADPDGLRDDLERAFATITRGVRP